MHYILYYDVADDYMTRRTQFRSEHLAHAKKALEAGELVLGGALADPVDQTMIVFRHPEAAERFAKDDPYVKNGLVKAWCVRKWTTVIGDGLEPPKG